MNFSENQKLALAELNKSNNHSFIIKSGRGCVMISAPHSVEQTRLGKIKFAEPQTGILAEMLHNVPGCHIIRKAQNRGDDANFDSVSDYKLALEKHVQYNNIKFLIDLHQLSSRRNVMINFGTGHGKNISNKALLDICTSAFSEIDSGIIHIDTPFAASYIHTVSSTIHRRCNIPCLQIEINSRLLCDKYSEYSLNAVYDALRVCCEKADEYFSGECFHE